MDIKNISYPGYGQFKIYADNSILNFRAETFLTKEPTTLEWLQSLESDSILLDVGANIGIYTLPSALYHVKKVISLEPEIRNFNMLLSNLKLNDLSCEKVEALPLAVSTKYADMSTNLYLMEGDIGSSCHQVGKCQDHLLQDVDPSKRQKISVYCVSLSSIVHRVSEHHNGPIHVKIDVDGIEGDVCQSLFDDKSIHRISSLQIELNKEIESHQHLISQLECAGFFYATEQVERSERKSGAFRGFAEIVFKRSLEINCLTFLPTQFLQILGANYKPIKILDHKNSDSNFLSLDKSKSVQLSRQPASYCLKNALDIKKCTQIFQEIAKRTILEENDTFKFSSVAKTSYANNLRFIIKNTTIESISPKYLQELFEQVQSINLLHKIKDLVNNASRHTFTTKYLDEQHAKTGGNLLANLRVVCRIRHFLDLYGYTLARHHDSFDTYCALVAPLFAFSTATSLITGGFHDRSLSLNGDPGILKNHDFGDIKFKSHAFKNNSSISSYVEYWKDSHSSQYRRKAPFNVQKSSLADGEIFVIPNMRSYFFGDLTINQNMQTALHGEKNNGHGVLPGVLEPYRPLLLVDYLLLAPENVPRSSDSESYFDLGEASALLLNE